MNPILAWFDRRRQRKLVKGMLHHAKFVRAMREDVADPESLQRLDEAALALQEAHRSGRGREAIEAAGGRLSEASARVSPPRPWPGLRENVEVIVVALGVAMAFRTYFIQPFKIPTGSMQPTMFGITFQPQEKRTWLDYPPVSFVSWALFGEGYVEVRARLSGKVESRLEPGPDGDTFNILVDGVRHRVRNHCPVLVHGGDYVAKGQVLASGRMRLGDFIFVNKIRYNFSRPRRGDIIVFDTTQIDYTDLKGDFYIKRLVGLPNEKIAIREPNLLADGKPVVEPFAFRRLVTDPRYHGYVHAGRLGSPDDAYTLGPDQFLPFGDNTLSSLDGRYFGPIKREALVGPAFMVYWPFSERWGSVR